jgi:hypothetical protein
MSVSQTKSEQFVLHIGLTSEFHTFLLLLRLRRWTTMSHEKDLIIKDTHRGLLYEDGVLLRVLEAGR